LSGETPERERACRLDRKNSDAVMAAVRDIQSVARRCDVDVGGVVLARPTRGERRARIDRSELPVFVVEKKRGHARIELVGGRSTCRPRSDVERRWAGEFPLVRTCL